MSDNKRVLYETTAVNAKSGNGIAYIDEEGGLELKVTNPLAKNQVGTNPEQLIALSWSSCLNSTVEGVLRIHHFAEDIDHSVTTTVRYMFDKDEHKRYFELEANVYIGVEQSVAEELLPEAEARCLVTQMLIPYEYTKVTVHGEERYGE